MSRSQPPGRGLVMPAGRRIPRPPDPRAQRPAGDLPDAPIEPETDRAAAELQALAARVRGCTACVRNAAPRAFGSGHPRSPILLVKERPSEADLRAETLFTEEAEPLQRAFDALGIPLSWVRGTSAVRCGAAAAGSDEVRACSAHLIAEIEAVDPRVIVAFGPVAAEAVAVLDGRCGMVLGGDLARSEPIGLRPGLCVILTEPLPEGLTGQSAKRRLWKDLQLVPGLLGSG